MASYSTNEFKNGLKILIDKIPYSIVETEFIKPGKGQAFNRVKLRNLYTGQVLEKTFKSGEKVTAADVMETEVQYLYTDGSQWHFMKKDGSYEQMAAGEAAMKDVLPWLQEEMDCSMTLLDGSPIMVEPPASVILEITETDPGLKGDTVSSGTKPAVLSTGARVKVPLFVEQGESIKVNTRTGEYISRVNKDK